MSHQFPLGTVDDTTRLANKKGTNWVKVTQTFIHFPFVLTLFPHVVSIDIASHTITKATTIKTV